MDSEFETLKSVMKKEPALSYQKITRAVTAMEEADLITPWRGVNNRICLTYDDAALLRQFIGVLRKGQTLRSAVVILRRDLERDHIERLRQEISDLRAENERLCALVEVKPVPRWLRIIRWLLHPSTEWLKMFRIATTSTSK